uniref:Uncharacterized protein n=1 Tax=Rhizophora mucronata TaxID=61149 RepID=A0A2P2L7P1_RHIMU
MAFLKIKRFIRKTTFNLHYPSPIS